MIESICPINLEAQTKQPCHKTNAGIMNCLECGKPCCPICQRHTVTQLSRVTGYIQAVSGFNAAKKQELKDRKRYNIGGN